MRRLRSPSGLVGLLALVLVTVSLSLGATGLAPSASRAAHLAATADHAAFVDVTDPRSASPLASLASVASAALLVVAAWTVLAATDSLPVARTDRARSRWWARLVGAPPLV